MLSLSSNDNETNVNISSSHKSYQTVVCSFSFIKKLSFQFQDQYNPTYGLFGGVSSHPNSHFYCLLIK